MTTLPIAPLWVWMSLAALLVLIVIVAVPKGREALGRFLDRTKRRIGAQRMGRAAFLAYAIIALCFAALWLALTLLLLTGLVGLILDIGWSDIPPFDATTDAAKEAVWNWRFKLAQLAALTAVLGAVVTMPITLNRLRLTRAQTETAKEALFNQKITEAAADLHAQRQVTLPETYKKPEGDAPRKRFNGWEDDVVRRNAAIDRLEGLVREQPEREIAERVARILSMYVRELSRETWPAKPPPETDDLTELRRWTNSLPPLRSDMQAAVATLSRLAAIIGVPARDLPFDLRESNLQGARLSEGDLQGADFSGAQMQGADLVGAEMQWAKLRGAQMQGATLVGAQMQGANLVGAQMQGADFSGAQMQGANLSEAQMQGAKLSGAQMQGAKLSEAQMQGAKLSGAQMQGAKLSGAQMQGANLVGAQMQGANLNWAKLSEDSDLTDATLRGASVRSDDDTTISQLLPFRHDLFPDTSVQLPEGVSRPDHWHPSSPDDPEGIDYDEFRTRWRAWQRSIGQDPEKPK